MLGWFGSTKVNIYRGIIWYIKFSAGDFYCFRKCSLSKKIHSEFRKLGWCVPHHSLATVVGSSENIPTHTWIHYY